ncbi:MAG: hypothetical protein ABI409_01820 [Ramlibacter sp.]
MNAQNRSLELGAVWYAIPMLWICVALVGSLLLAEWPALFAGPMPANEVVLSTAAPAAAPYVSSDPSLPPASQVFTGSDGEITASIDTF